LIFKQSLKKQKIKIEADNQTLKELNDTKNKFFSIIAHDLRGPLGSLYQLGKLLWQKHDKIDKDKQKKYLELLAQDAKRTFNLLDNLLKWARSNSGNIDFKPEIVRLNDIVEEIFELYRSMANEKKITLKNRLAGDLTFFADYNMVNTIIRNLLSNAVKFTSNNGQIEILSKNGTNGNIMIGISDSGIGIKPEILETLFNIDSKHTSLGTNQEKGSGLGLKLCREFAKKNNGKITVESTEGIGTIFWITLPSTDKGKDNITF